MFFWRIPAPNEALIISGTKRHDPSGAQFQIVVGHGTWVLPFRKTARKLSLDVREAILAEDCVTTQGIPLQVQAVCVFKVADDPASIANAARRFLDQQNRMEQLVGQVFGGHLRSIVGGLTVEEIIRDRERLRQEVIKSSDIEVERLGLTVDSLQIKAIVDPTGYIANIAAPHTAVVQKDARIAQAAADREATEREQEANALKSEAVRASQIKQAGYQAEVDRAAAQAGQAGPLAEAEARQQVVQTETAVARLEAQREEQRLQSTVNRPADAEAYKQVTLAKAAKESRVLDAEAEGQAIKVKGESEAGVLRVRADALRANQQALVTQQLAEHLPEIVTAATRSLTGANLTVLNGGEGLSELIGQVVGQGFSLFQGLRSGLGVGGPAENGPAAEGVRPAGETPAVEKAVGTPGPGGRPGDTASPGDRPSDTASQGGRSRDTANPSGQPTAS
jgi:uncharacterized membrane protein YqiK